MASLFDRWFRAATMRPWLHDPVDVGAEPSVSVIVPHYYSIRDKHLPVIAERLLAGSVPPAEVIVWNNEPAPLSGLPPAVAVIQSHRNLGAKARLAAALVSRSPVVLFQDNDLHVETDTVRNLLRYAAGDRWRSIYTVEGRRLRRGGAYLDSRLVSGRYIHAPVAVDVSLGRIELMHKRTLQRIVADFPFYDGIHMDDIYLSAVAASARIARWVVPCNQPHTGFENLDEEGVGSWITNPEWHFSHRTDLCRSLFDRLPLVTERAERAFPGFGAARRY
jgi:hypothetical protein